MLSSKQDYNKFLIALIKVVTVLLTYFNCALTFWMNSVRCTASAQLGSVSTSNNGTVMNNDIIKCFENKQENGTKKKKKKYNNLTKERNNSRELNMKTIFIGRCDVLPESLFAVRTRGNLSITP